MTERVKVLISNRQKDVKIPSGIRLLIRRCCHAVLVAENFHESAEISVSFVNNEQIRQLNAEYRQKDAPTDVLSFPLGSGGKYDRNMETGALQLGDIVISVEKAEMCIRDRSQGMSQKFCQPYIMPKHRIRHIVTFRPVNVLA